MVVDVPLVVAGVALLAWSADRFVDGAVAIATRLRLSQVVVGAVVIGVGTSAPELIVSVLATLRGEQDVAFGNVVGSNTANVLLVLGVAALVRPALVDAGTRRRELPVTVAAVAVLGFALADEQVTLLEGVALLLGGVLAVTVLVVGALRDRRAAARYAEEIGVEPGQVDPRRAAMWTVVGLVGVVVGAEALVRGAVGIAVDLGISSAVVGLTVVAVGTSLPELVTAIAAARQGSSDLVLGNVLGSNVFNSLPVAGTAGVLRTTTLDPAFSANVAAMVVAMLLGAALVLTGSRLTRAEGAVLLVGFVAWVVALSIGLLA